MPAQKIAAAQNKEDNPFRGEIISESISPNIPEIELVKEHKLYELLSGISSEERFEAYNVCQASDHYFIIFEDIAFDKRSDRFLVHTKAEKKVKGVSKGTLIKAGGALLEISGNCQPCQFIEDIRPGYKNEMTGRRGTLCRVIEGSQSRLASLHLTDR